MLIGVAQLIGVVLRGMVLDYPLRVLLYHGRVKSSKQLLYRHVKLSICP